MESITNTILNFTRIDTNTTLSIDSDTGSYYMLFGLGISAFLWVKLWGKVYYWFMIKVFKIMIWHDDKELKRRLDIYTSISSYGTNIPGIVGHSSDSSIGYDDLKKLLHASFNGTLDSDFFSYDNKSYITPQILTKVPLPGGRTSVLVENLQVVDDLASGRVLENRISRLKTKKVKTSPNDLRKHHGVRTKSSPNSTTKVNKGGRFVKTKIPNHDNRFEINTKSKNINLWQRMLDFFSKTSKKISMALNTLTTYSNDDLTATLECSAKYYRGNFLVLICDITLVLGLSIFAIAAYYTLKFEWTNSISPSILVAIFGLFKLSEVSNGLIGYVNIIWHDTLYRGDIVEIVGTLSSIGGKVVGVVYKISAADVYLLTNQPFTAHSINGNSRSEKEKKKTTEKTPIKDNVGDNKSVSPDNDIGKYSQPQGNNPRAGGDINNHDSLGSETIYRYLTINTAYRIPTLRARTSSEEESKFINKSSGVKLNKYNNNNVRDKHETLKNNSLFPKNSRNIKIDDEQIEMDEESDEDDHIGDADEKVFAYMRLNHDISGGDKQVTMTLQRFSETVDIVRLNTNSVYSATIYKKIGWNTNLKITL